MKKIIFCSFVAIALFEQSFANDVKCVDYLKQGDAYLARAVRYSNDDSWQKPSDSYSIAALAYYKRYDICIRSCAPEHKPKKNHFKK
jgi:hypothetical protein